LFFPDEITSFCLQPIFFSTCSKTSPVPAMLLHGHTARVFHTIWSPLLPEHLASGSDDRTIIVWNIDTRQSRPLQGHTHHVRALVWHTELPYILLSGSWDGSIRMWDIRTQVIRSCVAFFNFCNVFNLLPFCQSCIHVLSDHHADVYTLSAHPDRPFLFVSSSRDTSVRLWSLVCLGRSTTDCGFTQ
jgi:WD40 repeat protein